MTRRLEENRVLATIEASELEELRPHLEPVTMAQHDILIAPHEPIQYCYFPVTFLGSLVTVFEDGSTVEAGTIGHEGMSGVPVILDACATPMQTLVQIAGEGFRAPAAVVKKMFDSRRSFHQVVNRYIHTLFVIASQSAACNRRHQVEERLARWLLLSSDGIRSDDVALTHEFLSTMLGVRRAGVTEAAVKLQDAGLIQYKRGGVRIVDRKGLERASCECYRMVRNEHVRLFGKTMDER